MKFEKTEVWGFEHALRGMRNPLESWNKSDSRIKSYCDEDGDWVDAPCTYDGCCNSCLRQQKFFIGKNDLELAQKLIKAGLPHRKFLRQIFVAVDITAPLYWWKEFDTYKVGTVANSTSTMHKLASTPITMDCFEMDDFDFIDDNVLFVYNDKLLTINLYWEYVLIPMLENLRQKYNETKDKRYWKELIRLLPESWLQTRTVTMNYENILNMYQYRKNHKLSEWSIKFKEWVESLPYAKELIMGE